MKNAKNILTILAITLVFAALATLTACGGSGGGGNTTEDTSSSTTGGSGTIVTKSDGSAIISGIRVKDGTGLPFIHHYGFIAKDLLDYNGTLDFGYTMGDDADLQPIIKYIPDSSIKVTNGKLNLTLGVPKDEYLKILFNPEYNDDIIITSNSNVRVFWLKRTMATEEIHGEFFKAGSSYPAENYFAAAELVYVDRDVNIKGYGTNEYGTEETIDLSF